MSKNSKLNKNQVLSILDEYGEVSEDEFNYSMDSISCESEIDDESSKIISDQDSSIDIPFESELLKPKQIDSNIISSNMIPIPITGNLNEIASASFYKSSPKQVTKRQCRVISANKVKKKTKTGQDCSITKNNNNTKKNLDPNLLISKNGK
jgi:hypothetical protein